MRKAFAEFPGFCIQILGSSFSTTKSRGCDEQPLLAIQKAEN